MKVDCRHLINLSRTAINLSCDKTFFPSLFELSNKSPRAENTLIIFQSFGQMWRVIFLQTIFMITSFSTRSSNVRARPRSPWVRIGLFVYLSVCLSVALWLMVCCHPVITSVFLFSTSTLSLLPGRNYRVTDDECAVTVDSQRLEAHQDGAATPTVTLMLMLTSLDSYSCCSVARPPQHHDSLDN